MLDSSTGLWLAVATASILAMKYWLYRWLMRKIAPAAGTGPE